MKEEKQIKEKKLKKESVLSCGLSLLNNRVSRGVSTPTTLMPTGIGVTSLKFSKSDRKPNKTKHCSIPIL